MRIALVADIHGNVAALEAVVADLRTQGVDAVVNLGDCVSGPLWPRATFDLLLRVGWPTVRGHHDRWVGEEDPAALSTTDAFAATDVGEDSRRWLAALPTTLVPAPGVLAFHARPDDDNAYLTEVVADGRLVPADAATVTARLGPTAATVLFAAHSHLPTLVHLPDGRAIVNPGSAGCPAYDDPTPPAHVSESLSPAVRYAVLTLDMTGEATALGRTTFHAIPYDHAAAARRAREFDRPDWAYALTHGIIAPVAATQRVAKDTP